MVLSESTLRRDIEIEKKRIIKEGIEANKKEKLRNLQSELFRLKNNKQGKVATNVGRFIRKGASKVGVLVKKASPVVKKQVKLIRDQQLRDDAISRQRVKKLKPVKKKKGKIGINKRDIFGNLDF